MPYTLLKQKNFYFRNLSADGQQRFVERLYAFLEDKDFIGRHGLVITDEIRVLISASAVQLTFGLKDYTIPNLHTINVFPKAFYSKMFETSFKGLTTQGGVLSISWDDFKEGYAVEHDNLNLGLHELAHALNIDLDETGSYDNEFSYHFDRWKSVANTEFKRLREGSLTFFRKYGGTNFHEFFAVCIEYFFEAPDRFRLELPLLYGHTALMLNQDPENTEQDYKVKTVTEYFGANHCTETDTSTEQFISTPSEEYRESFSFRDRVKMILNKHGIYIAMTTTFVGLFLGIPLLIWFSAVTIVNIGTLMVLIFVCGALGLLQWRFVKNHLDMAYNHFAMYAFSGFAMCFLNLLLFLNLNLPVSGRTEVYMVDKLHIRINRGCIDVILDDPAIARSISTYLNAHYAKIPDAKKLTVKFATGILGLDTIEECKFD